MTGTWSAVIVNYNGGVFLDSCLNALTNNQLPPSEIMVIDNGSTDESLQDLAGWPQAIVDAVGLNLGFAAAANRGVRQTDADVVVILNPDVTLQLDFGRHLLSEMQDKKIGAAGPLLTFPGSGLVQHAGGKIHWPLCTTEHHFYNDFTDSTEVKKSTPVDYVTGGAMCLRRAAFDAAGGFDESFFPAYYEDVDLCTRIRQLGWSIEYRPQLAGEHFEGSTLGRSADHYRMIHQNRYRFAMKHLPQNVWWSGFIPAELQRLRGDLSAISDPTWPAFSGADVLEQLARTSGDSLVVERSSFDGAPLADAIASLPEVEARAGVYLEPLGPSASITQRLRRFLARISGRYRVDELMARQRQFNDSMVRTLKAQDRLNRELYASLLLSLLDQIDFEKNDNAESDDPRQAQMSKD